MRNYSAEEVMQYVSEMEVKFIRLAFCDIFWTTEEHCHPAQ